MTTIYIYDMSILSGINNNNTDVFTYCSDNCANSSWIDHVLCSYVMNKNVSDLRILYDYICSDHRPLSFVLNCQMSMPVSCNNNIYSTRSQHDWGSVDDVTKNLYAEDLFYRLGTFQYLIACVIVTA
jgi:hypothetical protein